jgi:hypothetical protein
LCWSDPPERVNDRLLTAKAMPDGKKPEGKVSIYFPKEKMVVFPDISSE